MYLMASIILFHNIVRKPPYNVMIDESSISGVYFDHYVNDMNMLNEILGMNELRLIGQTLC